MIIAGRPYHSTALGDVQFFTALIGARVRFRHRGEPFNGVIVQISEHGHNTIVAVDSGVFRRIDITDLERVDAVEQLLEPYQSAP